MHYFHKAQVFFFISIKETILIKNLNSHYIISLYVDLTITFKRVLAVIAPTFLNRNQLKSAKILTF